MNTLTVYNHHICQ